MATKVQRAVAMSTPNNRPSKHYGHTSRSGYTAAEKQSLLDNFDLEVEDKTRAFKATLAASMSSFMLRQDAEILKIPRDLRSMTIKDLEDKWGGSWSGTVQRIARAKIEAREKEEAAEREKVRVEEEARGKRKRAEEEAAGLTSPSRSSKNARREVPGSAKRVMPSSTSKRKLTTKTPRSKSTVPSTSSGPSSLPQDHIFNPALAATPGFPRRARRNESFFSANGSPIVILSARPSSPPAEDGHGSPSDQHNRPESEMSSEEEDEDLPDPEALEAQILAGMGTPKSKSKPSSRRPKRAPSLIFRQATMIPGSTGKKEEEPLEMAHIPLSDGRTVTFNPLDLSPGRIDAEMEEGGIGEQEKVKIKDKVKAAVYEALTSRMEKWKVL